jgi:hypothetical protein
VTQGLADDQNLVNSREGFNAAHNEIVVALSGSEVAVVQPAGLGLPWIALRPARRFRVNGFQVGTFDQLLSSGFFADFIE